MVAILQSWRVESAGILNPGNRSVDAGSNRLLVYVTGIRSPGDTLEEITSVTWGGQSLTRIDHFSSTSSSLGESHYSAWYLDDADIQAASGTAFVVTRSTTNSIQYRAYSATFVDVDQTSPIFDFQNTNAKLGVAAAITIDTDTSGYVFGQWLGNDQNGGTQDVVWSGLTEQVADFTNTQIYSSLAAATASGSQIVVSGTPTNHRNTVLGVVSLRNAAVTPEIDGSLNVGNVNLSLTGEVVDLVNFNGTLNTSPLGVDADIDIVNVPNIDGNLVVVDPSIILDGNIIPTVNLDSILNIDDVDISLSGNVIPTLNLDCLLNIGDVNLLSGLDIVPVVTGDSDLNVGTIQGTFDGNIIPPINLDASFDILPVNISLNGNITPTIMLDAFLDIGEINSTFAGIIGEGVFLNGSLNIGDIGVTSQLDIIDIPLGEASLNVDDVGISLSAQYLGLTLQLNGTLNIGEVSSLTDITIFDPISGEGEIDIGAIGLDGGISSEGVTIGLSTIEIIIHSDIVSIEPANTPIVKETE